MMFRLFIVAACVIAAAVGQDSPSCEVCGEGKEVGNPTGVFTFPNEPDAPCGDLQQAGRDGLILEWQCLLLPGLLRVCACTPVVGAPPTVSPAPTATPCAVCGEGYRISRKFDEIDFRGFQGANETVKCGTAELHLAAGNLDLDCTAELMDLFESSCGCIELAPLATIPPTDDPVDGGDSPMDDGATMAPASGAVAFATFVSALVAFAALL